jgi:hypothetical protein
MWITIDSPAIAGRFQEQGGQQHSGGSEDEGDQTQTSYKFSYNAGDHSRTEKRAPNGDVEGQYTFKADDGVERTVKYRAGANVGFVAEGDHLPQVAQAQQQQQEHGARRRRAHELSHALPFYRYSYPNNPGAFGYVTHY